MAVNIAEPLQELFGKIEGGGRELTLDLSSVERLDAAALGEMERLAAAAEAKSVKVAVRGVNVDVYKVMKLMNLAPRFTFVA